MRPILFVMMCVICLGLGATASAAEGDAESFLKARQATVDKVLERVPKDAQGDELSKVIGDLLDYQELSRRALSDHWDSRSEAERAEFVLLLRQLVERNYRKNLRSTRGFEIHYADTQQTPEGTVVRSIAKSKANKRRPAVEISYTMHQAGGAWRVVDITTDGVSMVRNYRGQFNRIIRKEGWAPLITRMKERLANEGDF